MHKVLLFDDRRQVHESLKLELESKGMTVFPCRSVYRANEAWEKHKDYLDAIILDVMMPTYGLPDELSKMTNKGELTGWIWLWYALNPNNEAEHPAAGKCIVVYSAYYALEKHLDSEFADAAEKHFSSRAMIIKKGDSKQEDDIINKIISDRKVFFRGIYDRE